MWNRSLIFFIALSLSAHAVALMLWPATEPFVQQRFESAVEIGMVSLPRIEKEFTRDFNRLQQLAQMIQRQSIGQTTRATRLKLSADDTGRRQSNTPDEIALNKTKAKTLPIKMEESLALAPVSNSTHTPDKNPVTSSKAAPLYALNPAPVYPENALKYGWEGEVWLKIMINRSGSVGNIEIIQSSDYQVLDQAAVKTVRHWRFEPARIGKEAVEGTVSIPIRFRIRRS